MVKTDFWHMFEASCSNIQIFGGLKDNQKCHHNQNVSILNEQLQINGDTQTQLKFSCSKHTKNHNLKNQRKPQMPDHAIRDLIKQTTSS